MNKRIFGFTLIELMIVVAIIAIIAAIAIPGLLRARISANEGSAIGSLRSLATAQAQCQSNCVIDQNSNGTGEYGLFNEITGANNIRATTGNQAMAISPGYLTRAFRVNIGNAASKAGYYYRIYLPVNAGTPITDQNTVVTGNSYNGPMQETNWIAYAWPVTFKTSGIRVFAVDQSAEVSAQANVNATNGNAYYFGAGNQPAFTAGMVNGTPAVNFASFGGLAINANGLDARTWTSAGS